jgi:hypothetical protein
MEENCEEKNRKNSFRLARGVHDSHFKQLPGKGGSNDNSRDESMQCFSGILY